MAPPQTCPACGSDDLGRGRCRTAWQEFVRDVTPLRRFRCHACGSEGWTARQLPHSHHPSEQARARHGGLPGGRPVEERDRQARWRSAARFIVTVLAALLLGLVVADRLVSCQGQPPPSSGE
jgi:hypothetical protein